MDKYWTQQKEWEGESNNKGEGRVQGKKDTSQNEGARRERNKKDTYQNKGERRKWPK